MKWELMITLKRLATGQGDHYATGFLPNYLCFKERYEMIAIDFDKQWELDSDPEQCNKVILL